MKRTRLVPISLALMACVGMLMPQVAFAEFPVAKPQANKTMDVSLHDEGLLVGQVVNPQGTAKEGVLVSLMYKERELARTKTDKRGRFAVKGLKGGNYKLATAGTSVPVRAWTKATAPRTAAVGALLVEGMTVRGQYPTLADEAPNGTTTPSNSTTYHVAGEGTAPTDPSVNYGGQTTTHSTGSYSSGSYAGGQAAAYPGAGYGAAAGGSAGGGGLLGFGILGGGGGVFGVSPLLIGAGVAAAIAIPVALDDDDDDAS